LRTIKENFLLNLAIFAPVVSAMKIEM